MVHKSQYFPPRLHPYFNNDDYDPLMPQFERDYLDAYILQRCYVNGQIIKLPTLSEQLIQELKRFQNNSLMQHTMDTSVAPWLMLEVMYMYMENAFIIQPSTIPTAGNGLFLRPGQSLSPGIFLPYSGTVQVNDAMTPQILLANDKLLCIRPSVYLDGSVSTVFPITGSTYPPYIAMANEKVCHNMFEINRGKIIDCGMVVFASPVSGSPTAPTEVFVLYSPLTNSTSALLEEPSHRTMIKLQTLMDLYEHMDDCVYGLKCYTPDFRAHVKSKVRQLLKNEVDINLYRVMARRKSSEDVDTVFNYVQACVAVVDGRFLEYLTQVHPKFMKSVSSQSIYRVPFTTNTKRGQLYLPVALLFQISTQFYYGNYNDPIRKAIILQQGHTHHRNMIHVMFANNQIVTTAKSKHMSKFLASHGVLDFQSTRFSIEDLNYETDDDDSTGTSTDDSDHDVASDDEVPPLLSPSRTSVSDTTRASPTRLSPVPITASITAPTVALPTQLHCNPPPVSVARQESVTDEPSTPLTHATYRDNLRQDMRSILLEDGHLPIAPRYERQKQYRENQKQYREYGNRTKNYDDEDSQSFSNHTNHRSSVSTQEIEPGLKDYDPTTLPNTLKEALRWVGQNKLPYTEYVREQDGQLGRFSGHHLVKNHLDLNSQSTLYNDVMVLSTNLLTFWSVDFTTYHKIDKIKMDFSLNDRAKIQHSTETYDGSGCFYSYIGRIFQHFYQHRLPYVYLYDILSKGTDLRGRALIEWQEQIQSVNSSLVHEDITYSILRSPSLPCYQMCDIVEMIVDLIVFRVLIFGQVKNKTSMKQELFTLKLVSNIHPPSVTYDGILKLAQTVIRTFRLFINDDNAVQELVKILTKCIWNTGNDYAQISVDFNFNVSQRVQAVGRDAGATFHAMSRAEKNIEIFTVIEKYCKELQDLIRQSIHQSQGLAITSPPTPTHSSVPTSKSYPSSSFRPRGVPSPNFKRVHVHSAMMQATPANHSEELHRMFNPTIHSTQSHHLHIGNRVDCTLHDVHAFAQARIMAQLLDDQSDELPEGALFLQSDDSEEPTIHVQVAHVHDLEATSQSKQVIDTKYTVDKVPFMGNCSLCGERKHDANHCRVKSYEDPNKVNLANFTYHTDEILHDKLQKAHEFGFLRGATQDEIKWVVDKIRELRQARTLLYSQPPTNRYPSNSYSPRTPPRSNSPYGYNRSASPSPYERQSFQPPTQQSL